LCQFQRKLELYKTQLQASDLSNFENLKTSHTCQISKDQIEKYVNLLDQLLEFQKRFADLADLDDDFKVFLKLFFTT